MADLFGVVGVQQLNSLVGDVTISAGTGITVSVAGQVVTITNSSLAAVNSVTNADGSLTFSPTTGAVVGSLNTAHANTFTALQTFGNYISFGGAQLNVSSLATGNIVKYNGTNWVNHSYNYGQASNVSYSTTSTTAVMLGAGFSLTPTANTIVKLTMTGLLYNSVLLDTVSIGVQYGTGFPPAAGAAQTGTNVLNMGPFTNGQVASTAGVPVSASVVISGLTIGTSYWFDFYLAAGGGGTAYLKAYTLIVEEM